MSTQIRAEHTYAAIDLGSNSFHMAVAGATDNHLQMIDKLRKPVRLGAGLDADNNLSAETIESALSCLAMFQQRLRGVPDQHIRAVGTNTLRRARNADEFGRLAERALGVPIEIISGREEARLIFKGVTFGTRDELTRLVVDIGGGSTELILGTGSTPQVMESINVGCVSSHNQWFADGNRKIGRQWQRAVQSAQLEMQAIKPLYQAASWQRCVGSSGTIKATQVLLSEIGCGDTGIHRDNLEQLGQRIESEGSDLLDDVRQISGDRKQVIVGGLAVLLGVFREFDIDIMHVAHTALREGVIIDLAAGSSSAGVRQAAIADLQRRFQIDEEQVARISGTAGQIFAGVAEAWQLNDRRDLSALMWACQLHEIGLSVAHVQYHKHGDYLLRNADMLGFTRGDQALVATLVRNHRRKIQRNAIDTLAHYDAARFPKLLAILRLAVLMHRTRNASLCPPLKIFATDNALELRIDADWLQSHPLTRAELEDEIPAFAALDLQLAITPIEPDSRPDS
jgi:exopolyphosphatase/guanosine-5'-triphosphate,3'-diphosphate pyrophosphatase